MHKIFTIDNNPYESSTVQAFPVVAARIWNNLPQHVTTAPSMLVSRRLISSPFPIRVPDHVQCSRSDIFISDTLIIHVTYLLTSKAEHLGLAAAG